MSEPCIGVANVGLISSSVKLNASGAAPSSSAFGQNLRDSRGPWPSRRCQMDVSVNEGVDGLSAWAKDVEFVCPSWNKLCIRRAFSAGDISRNWMLRILFLNRPIPSSSGKGSGFRVSLWNDGPASCNTSLLPSSTGDNDIDSSSISCVPTTGSRMAKRAWDCSSGLLESGCLGFGNSPWSDWRPHSHW